MHGDSEERRAKSEEAAARGKVSAKADNKYKSGEEVQRTLLFALISSLYSVLPIVPAGAIALAVVATAATTIMAAAAIAGAGAVITVIIIVFGGFDLRQQSQVGSLIFRQCGSGQGKQSTCHDAAGNDLLPDRVHFHNSSSFLFQAALASAGRCFLFVT